MQDSHDQKGCSIGAFGAALYFEMMRDALKSCKKYMNIHSTYTEHYEGEARANTCLSLRKFLLILYLSFVFRLEHNEEKDLFCNPSLHCAVRVRRLL